MSRQEAIRSVRFHALMVEQEFGGDCWAEATAALLALGVTQDELDALDRTEPNE